MHSALLPLLLALAVVPAQGAEIRAIELDNEAGGAAVTIRSDTRLSWTTSFERDGSMIVRLDEARPVAGLALPTPDDGLVSSVALRADEESATATRVVIETRGPVASAVIAGDQELVVRLRPAVRMSLPATGASGHRVTATPCLRARSLPRFDARILTCLPTDTRVQVVDSLPEWSKIELPGGDGAWVAERFLAAPASGLAATPTGQRVPVEPLPPAETSASEPPSTSPPTVTAPSEPERLRAELEAANQARTDLAAQLSDVARDRDELNRRLQDLESEAASPNPALEALVQGLRSENNRLAGRVEELERANRELAGRVADSGDRQTELREQRDDLATRLEALETENTALSSQLDESASAMEDAAGRLAASQRENQRLEALLAAPPEPLKVRRLAARVTALERDQKEVAAQLAESRRLLAAEQDSAAELEERLEAAVGRAEDAERRRDELAEELRRTAAERQNATPAADPEELARAIAETRRLATALRAVVDERDALRQELSEHASKTAPDTTAEVLVVPEPPLAYEEAPAPPEGLLPAEPLTVEELEQPAPATEPDATPATSAATATGGVQEPVAPVAEAEPPGFDELSEQAKTLVATWAAAWSDQRVDDYLSFYAPDFRPNGGTGRANWETQRKLRLARPAFIEVITSEVAVPTIDTESAVVTFRQAYRSDSFADVVRKTLELTRVGDEWKIVRETAE